MYCVGIKWKKHGAPQLKDLPQAIDNKRDYFARSLKSEKMEGNGRVACT